LTRNAEVQRGTLLVREGLLLPAEVEIVTEDYSPAWRAVSGSGTFDLDQELRKSGWACFFFAGELNSISFGAGSLKNAVLKVLAQVRLQNFNCAELTSVSSSHFLGIPYSRVRGHSRHIQRGCEIDSVEKRERQQKETDWALR
jgi:hypothetical protein